MEQDLLKRLGTRYCERCKKPSQVREHQAGVLGVRLSLMHDTVLSMCENCWNDLHYERLQTMGVSFCRQCQDAIDSRDLVYYYGGKQAFCDTCRRAYLAQVSQV